MVPLPRFEALPREEQIVQLKKLATDCNDDLVRLGDYITEMSVRFENFYSGISLNSKLPWKSFLKELGFLFRTDAVSRILSNLNPMPDHIFRSTLQVKFLREWGELKINKSTTFAKTEPFSITANGKDIKESIFEPYFDSAEGVMNTISCSFIAAKRISRIQILAQVCFFATTVCVVLRSIVAIPFAITAIYLIRKSFVLRRAFHEPNLKQYKAKNELVETLLSFKTSPITLNYREAK